MFRMLAGVLLAKTVVPARFHARLLDPTAVGATLFNVAACTAPYAASLITNRLLVIVPLVVLLYSNGYLPVVCSVSRNAPGPTYTVLFLTVPCVWLPGKTILSLIPSM